MVRDSYELFPLDGRRRLDRHGIRHAVDNPMMSLAERYRCTRNWLIVLC